MLVALRAFSLGDRDLAPGDEIRLDEQRLLPTRRVEQLKTLRLVEEQYGEQVLEREIADLKARVAKLEGKPAKRRARKTPTNAKVAA